jgi:hypothetical protein
MRSKDQIKLEQVYSKLLNENLGTGFQIQKGGTNGVNIKTLDEIQIGNDVYAASYDVDLSRSVEPHGTFYDEPKIYILGVWKYDPEIDDNVELQLQTIDKEILSKIESAIHADVESDIDNDRYDFYRDEPDHEDI